MTSIYTMRPGRQTRYSPIANPGPNRTASRDVKPTEAARGRQQSLGPLGLRNNSKTPQAQTIPSSTIVPKTTLNSSANTALRLIRPPSGIIKGGSDIRRSQPNDILPETPPTKKLQSDISKSSLPSINEKKLDSSIGTPVQNITRELRRENTNSDGFSKEQADTNFTPFNISKSYTGTMAGARALSGLRNLGNTCFMNSILQCIAHTPGFADELAKSNVARDINQFSKLRGDLALKFSDLIRSMRTQTEVSPFEIKHLIGRLAPQFMGYNQQDSCEFLRVLLDGLHHDLNRVRSKPRYQEMSGDSKKGKANVALEWWEYSLSRDNSLVTDFFQGQQVSTISCKKCGYETLSCDTFLDLALSLPDRSSATIQECFDNYTALSGVLESYRCEKCKNVKCCTQQSGLWRYPKIMVIQLKRFSCSSWSRSKLSTEIEFPEALDLRRYSHNKEEVKYGVYRLYGVSHHMGSLKSGHYIA